jgi:anti-sigma B factor antagonist
VIAEETLPTAVSNPEPNTIALEGEIDLHESPNVREALRNLTEQKLPRVFVDLSGVSYIDSSGIAVLIEAMQRIQAYGGKLALFGIRDSVRTVFEIARLDQVFKIFPDQNAAVRGI